jgi:uncharacterized membrane protein YeaQ/YmgE (transglycosylase-associated protein family)
MAHPLETRPIWFQPVFTALIVGFLLGLTFTITSDSATTGLIMGVLFGIIGFVVAMVLTGTRGKTTPTRR